MENTCTVVWLRRDLRVADNPALCEAAARGPVLPLFIWAPEEEAPWQPGAASRVWLHDSLQALAAQLEALGSPLVLRAGASLETLQAVARESSARAVLWNRCHEPAFTTRDAQIKTTLREAGLEVRSSNATLLNEPHAICNKKGLPFRVFTPYYRHCASLGEPLRPAAAPRRLVPPAASVRGLSLTDLRLRPDRPWDCGIREAWRPGSAGGTGELQGFNEASIIDYGEGRDRPDRGGVSRLSPHLHFGELSPRQVWHQVMDAHGSHKRGRDAVEPFLRQLYWREFAHHLLFHFPDTPHEPLQHRFARFPWRHAPADLKTWQRGQTGYPLVDAGMRELWHTGWMHNRVRMNAGSFLVKHLLIDWREGARWFWDTLVDADLANNTMGWQWCAGSGADAAPYFRIFNPVAQGQRFDPRGLYIRKWIPQLAGLPDDVIHRPWEASASVLAAAGVRLGEDYPRPVVDHRQARERALAALASSKG